MYSDKYPCDHDAWIGCYVNEATDGTSEEYNCQLVELSEDEMLLSPVYPFANGCRIFIQIMRPIKKGSELLVWYRRITNARRNKRLGYIPKPFRSSGYIDWGMSVLSKKRRQLSIEDQNDKSDDTKYQQKRKRNCFDAEVKEVTITQHLAISRLKTTSHIILMRGLNRATASSHLLKVSKGKAQLMRSPVLTSPLLENFKTLYLESQQMPLRTLLNGNRRLLYLTLRTNVRKELAKMKSALRKKQMLMFEKYGEWLRLVQKELYSSLALLEPFKHWGSELDYAWYNPVLILGGMLVYDKII